MHINDLRASIMSRLQDELDRHGRTIESFPYFIHVTGQQDGSFYVSFSLSNIRSYFTGSRDSNVVAAAHCKIIPQLFNERIMLEIRIRQTKKNNPSPEFGEYKYYRDQSWRYEKFIIECSAIGIWHMLENNINHDVLIAEVLST